MDERLRFRLEDILDALIQPEAILHPLDFPSFLSDRVRRAACERFLDIISEASRHIPPALKTAYPGIPWRQIADIGNHLRHAYHAVDAEILWQVHNSGDLQALEVAVSEMLRTAERY